MPVLTKRKGAVTDRYIAYIDVITAFYKIKLSPMEKKVLNGFFWVDNGRINTKSRKILADNLKMSSFNLNNQILKLRRKKLIIQNKANTEEDIITKDFLPDIEASKPSFIIQLEVITKE